MGLSVIYSRLNLGSPPIYELHEFLHLQLAQLEVFGQNLLGELQEQIPIDLLRHKKRDDVVGQADESQRFRHLLDGKARQDGRRLPLGGGVRRGRTVGAHRAADGINVSGAQLLRSRRGIRRFLYTVAARHCGRRHVGAFLDRVRFGCSWGQDGAGEALLSVRLFYGLVPVHVRIVTRGFGADLDERRILQPEVLADVSPKLSPVEVDQAGCAGLWGAGGSFPGVTVVAPTAGW